MSGEGEGAAALRHELAHLAAEIVEAQAGGAGEARQLCLRLFEE